MNNNTNPELVCEVRRAVYAVAVPVQPPPGQLVRTPDAVAVQIQVIAQENHEFTTEGLDSPMDDKYNWDKIKMLRVCKFCNKQVWIEVST